MRSIISLGSPYEIVAEPLLRSSISQGKWERINPIGVKYRIVLLLVIFKTILHKRLWKIVLLQNDSPNPFFETEFFL